MMSCKQSLLAILLLAPLAGCVPIFLLMPNPALHFYPVQGPASESADKVVLSAEITGSLSGTIRLHAAGGETCVGAWARVPNGEMDNGLASAWDLVYGAGTYTAKVLGSPSHLKASAEGSAGTRFLIEFYRDPIKGAPLVGVAKDNAGNTYKVVI